MPDEVKNHSCCEIKNKGNLEIPLEAWDIRGRKIHWLFDKRVWHIKKTLS